MGWKGGEVSLLRTEEMVGQIILNHDKHADEFEPYSMRQLGAKKGCFIQTNSGSVWACHCP